MGALFGAVGAGLLLVALVLGLTGFVTNQWTTAELDSSGLEDIIKTTRAKTMPPGLDQLGMDVKQGLWSYCMKVNFGNLFDAMSGKNTRNFNRRDAGDENPSGEDAAGWKTGDEDAAGWKTGDEDTVGWKTDEDDAGWRSEEQFPQETDDSLPEIGDDSPEGMMGGKTEKCTSTAKLPVPDWMEAVRALGIISLFLGGCAFSIMIYSFIGNSKGDRARLLPHIIAGISLAAGIFLLIAVIVYGAEYEKMVHQMMAMLGSELGPLAKNISNHIHLGYSFALETVASLLMIGVGLLVLIPMLMGFEGVMKNPQNMAV